jgi:hypothetical protein
LRIASIENCRYSLDGDQEAKKLFQIDELTGRITTSDIDLLDFETDSHKVHKLTIIAKDRGEETGTGVNTNEIEATVTVLNVNDEAPSFQNVSIYKI